MFLNIDFVVLICFFLDTYVFLVYESFLRVSVKMCVTSLYCFYSGGC